jgi:hypothetical protein
MFWFLALLVERERSEKRLWPLDSTISVLTVVQWWCVILKLFFFFLICQAASPTQACAALVFQVLSARAWCAGLSFFFCLSIHFILISKIVFIPIFLTKPSEIIYFNSFRFDLQKVTLSFYLTIQIYWTNYLEFGFGFNN